MKREFNSRNITNTYRRTLDHRSMIQRLVLLTFVKTALAEFAECAEDIYFYVQRFDSGDKFYLDQFFTHYAFASLTRTFQKYLALAEIVVMFLLPIPLL